VVSAHFWNQQPTKIQALSSLGRLSSLDYPLLEVTKVRKWDSQILELSLNCGVVVALVELNFKDLKKKSTPCLVRPTGGGSVFCVAFCIETKIPEVSCRCDRKIGGFG
jgi:hypothetical protein